MKNYKIPIKNILKTIMGNVDIGVRTRKMHIIRELNKIDLSEKVILDAGCGVGEYMFEVFSRYNPKELIGIEIDREKVNHINNCILNKKGWSYMKVICGDLSKDTLPKNKFDVCFCIDVLEHIKDDKNAIKNIFDSLKNNGIFIAHVPNLETKRFFKEFINYHQPDHVRDGYNLTDFIDLLENVGFKIIKTKYTGGPLVELSWEIEKKLEKILPRRLSQALCYPLTFVSVFLDIKKNLRNGNGILVISQKIAHYQDYMKHPLFDLIIFPMHDWKKCEKEGFRNRDSHLIQEFEKSEKIRKILIVDRPITLPEMILKKRFWRVKKGEIIKRSKFTCLTKVSEKIFVLDIFSFDLIQPLVLQRDWWSYIFRKDKTVQKIREAISYLNMENKVLFLASPLATPVIGKLDEKLVVFDAIDDWTKHPQMKDRRGWIKEGYEIIKEKADLIFANSIHLQIFLANPRTQPIVVFNGVNKEYFNLKENKVPLDLKNISKPIIGYAGTLAKRIDVGLLSYLSSKLPKFSFVLIGPILDKKWIKNLKKLPNVYYLGNKHYSELPFYISNFDVCIIPHSTDFEYGEEPIKLYEYLAAGKPVVTTPIQEVDKFKDIITIAKTKEEFLEGILYWLKRIDEDKSLPQKLINSLPESVSWKSRANIMIENIIKILEVKSEK